MFRSDYPRGLVRFWLWRFTAFDALTIAPALPVAFRLANCCFPVPLLRLPSRPFSEPLSDIPHCNIAGSTAADERTARILSADSDASSAGGVTVFAEPLDFRNGL